MESTINPSPVLKYPYAHLRPAPDVSDPRRRKLETTVQSLITRIKERMQSLVGFEETRQLRFLLDELKKFDGNHDGFLTPEEFASFLMTLNYIGRNPDIDMLFCMFDDDLLGLVEYKEFAKCIYGKGKFPLLNADSKVVMQEIRDILVATDLHAPILFAQEMLEVSKMCDDKGSFTDKEFTEIIQARLGPVMSSLPRPRRLQFLNYFHFHQEAKVHLETFLRELKSGMTVDRKHLVRAIFDKMDPQGKGYLTSEEIGGCYNLHPSTKLTYRGQSIIRPSLEELLNYLVGEGRGCTVEWLSFLDYYRYLSLGVGDDEVFEYLIRNSWIISKGSPGPMSPNSVSSSTRSQSFLLPSSPSSTRKFDSPTTRHVVVRKACGQEVIAQIVDELGQTRLDEESVLSLVKEQGFSDASCLRY